MIEFALPSAKEVSEFVLAISPALLAFIASMLVIKIFKFFVLHRLAKIAKRTKTDFDDLLISIVRGFGWPLYALLSLYIALYFIPTSVVEVPAIAFKLSYALVVVSFIYYLAKSAERIVHFWVGKFIPEKTAKGLVSLLNNATKLFLWGLALIILLANLGFDASALIASFGIVGLAVGFAARNIIEDIFSCIMIYVDKPFEVGDLIAIGNDMGIVEKIGIKSTRIRLLRGEELIVSNRELAKSKVRNFRKVRKWRELVTINIEAPETKVAENVLKVIERVLKSIKLVEFEYACVKSVSASKASIEFAYYVVARDYASYANVLTEVNLKLRKELEKIGIKIL